MKKPTLIIRENKIIEPYDTEDRYIIRLNLSKFTLYDLKFDNAIVFVSGDFDGKICCQANDLNCGPPLDWLYNKIKQKYESKELIKYHHKYTIKRQDSDILQELFSIDTSKYSSKIFTIEVFEAKSYYIYIWKSFYLKNILLNGLSCGFFKIKREYYTGVDFNFKDFKKHFKHNYIEKIKIEN